MSSSAATAASTASPTATSGPGSNSSSGPSSPLLFFVALGFGVVFTNLWIIVGVKYCFRYNQRNRARMNGEDPDAVDLGAMPRQHRRRREKKLMTMDEVNEKFPLTKYKTWRSSRAEEGLPTAGGINTASRPASIHHPSRDSHDLKDVSATADLGPAPTASTVGEPLTTPAHGQAEEVGEKSDAGRPSTPRRPESPESSTPETPMQKVTSNEDEDEDEQIQTAVPAEQLPDPGDACAICIDTIEDDDDIRGLHCGHAFHASCVDPWLTSRRACCPLCKADYYVPKARPDGPNPDGSGRNGADIRAPPTAFSLLGNGRPGARPGMMLPGRFMSIVYHDRDRHGFPVAVRAERPGQVPRRSTTSSPNTDSPSPPSGWRARLGGWRMPGRRPAAAPSSAPDTPAAPEIQVQPTPSQLEAQATRPP